MTTGNKSELATGYCTLYGDMAGGLAVISDAPKTLVYRLARAFNADSVAGAAPADSRVDADEAAIGGAAARSDRSGQPAALRPARCHPGGAPRSRGSMRRRWSARGFAAAVVDDVLRRVRTSEYKRRQMPPGLKITGKAFGPGRRYPIARAARLTSEPRKAPAEIRGLPLRDLLYGEHSLYGPRSSRRRSSERNHASCHYRFAR